MISFISLFFWSRIWVLPKIAIAQMTIPYLDSTVKDRIDPCLVWTANVMMVAILVLNVFWFYKIIMGVHRVMTKGLKEAKSGTRDADSKVTLKEGPKQH